MDKDELIDQIVKEGLSITTYGTQGQVQHQIAVNVAKAAVARLQPSGDEGKVPRGPVEPVKMPTYHFQKPDYGGGSASASSPPTKAEPSYSAGYTKAIEDAARVAQGVDSWGLRGDALKAVIRQRTFIANSIRALAGKDEI